MLLKSISHDIKDLDAGSGVVVAYANVYGNKDSDGDISAPGSFVKTVSENFKRIRVLKDHQRFVSLGVPKNLNAKDNYGLWTESQFNMEKEVSRDMFTDIRLYKENGLNAELSIGYEVVKRDEKEKAIITEYKLFEYSFLTSWAANELATVQDIKAHKSVAGFIDLLAKAYDMDYSDTRLKQIENILTSLTQSEPPVGTLTGEPGAFIKQLSKTFLTN